MHEPPPNTLPCSCGHLAIPSMTRYGIRHDCYVCGRWSWGGKDPVCRNTHEARKAAHALIDELWKSKRFKRGFVYLGMQSVLGLTAKEAHMSVMDAPTARKVVSEYRNIVKWLEDNKT